MEFRLGPIHLDLSARFAKKTGAIIPPTADRPRFYSHTPAHPSQGLTPSKLAALLQKAERGDMEAQAELISDLLDKEPTLVGLFQTRAYGVLSKSWSIEPDPEATKSKAAKQAKWLESVLRNISIPQQSTPLAAEYLTWDEAREFLLSAIPYGYAVAFTEWDRKTWHLSALRAVEHKHFMFGDIGKQGLSTYSPYELRYRTEEYPADGVNLEPMQAVVHYYKAKPVLPSRFSLARTLAYWYMFKLRAVSALARYGERFGDPLVLGYYDPNDQTGDTDKAVVQQAVQQLGQAAAAVISRVANDSSPRVEFIEPKGSATDVQEQLINLVNMEYSKAVCGHENAAQAVAGKLGEETNTIDTVAMRYERDAIAFDCTVTEQILRPMAEGVDGELLCRYKTHYERPENLTETAAMVQTLATVPGFRIPAAYLYEKFDIPVPKQDEETVGAPVGGDPMADAMRSAAQNAAKGATKAAASHIHSFVATPGSAGRRERAKQLYDALQAEAAKLQKQTAPIYAALLNGVKPKGDIAEQIRENLDDFRADFEPVISASIIRSGNLALKSMDPGSNVATMSANPTFDLADDAAIKFLDWQAFTLTVIEGELISTDLAERIATATAAGAQEGITMREFYARILDEAGVGATNRYHMETVFRTNLGTAANASKLFAMAHDPEGYPGWEFMAVMDDNTTDNCRPLDGKIFAKDDRKNFPPLHFNCRSIGTPITAAEWEAEGLQAEKYKPMGQDGFENTAVRGYDDWVASEADKSDAINDIITNYKGK